MSFNSIFDYSKTFSEDGEASPGNIEKDLYGASDETKLLRETSPESATVISALGRFLKAGAVISEQQKEEGNDSSSRITGAKERAADASESFATVDDGLKENPYPDNQNKRKR